jgi:hypothetical protein
MRTKYEKPTVVAVYNSIAEGAVCNIGSHATPATTCITGGTINSGVLPPPTNCHAGGVAGPDSCNTGSLVIACNTGGAPTSHCTTGDGVGS